MTLMAAVIEPSLEFGLETYEQAKAFQTNLVWQKLDEITLEEALSHWLSTLGQKTRINYRETVITYSDSIMKSLRAYIGDRTGP